MKIFSSYPIFAFLLLVFLISCTKIMDEETATNNYTGGDGCVYCHTNAARLQVLAAESEDHGGGGGGG